MAQVKAIIVDYGGVLIQKPSEPDFLAPQAEALGITPAQLKDAVWGENNHRWNQTKVGAISEDEMWEQVADALEIRMANADILRQKLFLQPNVHQAFVDYLYTLRDRYKLALLSNAIPSFSAAWEQLGFTEWFDVLVNSSDVKLAKPDPAIYQLTADRLGVAPAQCVFIDDQTKNFGPAAELGLHCIHFEDSQQTIAALDGLLN